MSGRRLLLLILALWYLVSTTGAASRVVAVSLEPATMSRAGSDQADFPCAHHVCGCTDAETCRTSCCCFPRVPVARACPSCADETPTPLTSGPRAGRVMHCGCPSPVAFLETRAPEQDRRHATFTALIALPAGFVRPSFARDGVAGFLEPSLKVPISS